MDGMASVSQGGSLGGASSTGAVSGGTSNAGGQGMSQSAQMSGQVSDLALGQSGAGFTQGSDTTFTQSNAAPMGQASEASPEGNIGEATQGGQQTANQAEQRTAYTPDAYSFTMPNAVANDAALVSRIQDFCAGAQLSPQQAQAAMAFWQSEQNAIMEQGLQQCEQSLKDSWQGAYGERLEQARTTLKVLDTRMGGRLMPLVKGPLGNSPVFAEMLHHLSDVVSESTMEAGGMGGTRSSFGGSQRMSTEDFLRQVVFK